MNKEYIDFSKRNKQDDMLGWSEICLDLCIMENPNELFVQPIHNSDSVVKNLPEIQATQVRSLGQEDLLEKGLATHSSILAGRIPWTE